MELVAQLLFGGRSMRYRYGSAIGDDRPLDDSVGLPKTGQLGHRRRLVAYANCRSRRQNCVYERLLASPITNRAVPCARLRTIVPFVFGPA
jgi:hypothetical protein